MALTPIGMRQNLISHSCYFTRCLSYMKPWTWHRGRAKGREGFEAPPRHPWPAEQRAHSCPRNWRDDGCCGMMTAAESRARCREEAAHTLESALPGESKRLIPRGGSNAMLATSQQGLKARRVQELGHTAHTMHTAERLSGCRHGGPDANDQAQITVTKACNKLVATQNSHLWLVF